MRDGQLRVPIRVVMCATSVVMATMLVAPASATADISLLPLSFEANRGQTHSEVQFLVRGRGHTVFLTFTGAVLALRKPDPAVNRSSAHGKPERPATTGTLVRVSFVGSNLEPRVIGENELPGKANYFIGSDRSTWRTNVPTFARVRYRDVYPGIDVVYYGTDRQLEYDFVVTPGADPNTIVLGFAGTDQIEIDDHGDLVLHTAIGALIERKPFAYQLIDGVRREITSRYVLKGEQLVGFEVGTYDRRRPLIIDPVLFYSSYLGGSGFDEGQGIAVDSAGNAYVTGGTASLDFPTTPGAFQTTVRGGEDVFVTKLNPTGSGVVYSTYLGGHDTDVGLGIAVDAAGNAYVTGFTRSSDFPTVNPIQATFHDGTCFYGPCNEGFVAKLNASGSALLYSTYLGGQNSGDEDVAFGIAVDSAGSAYVTGRTGSANFPTTTGAYRATFCGGSWDVFVTKLDPLGLSLVYSTYVCGSGGSDEGRAIALDGVGNAYVTGLTQSSDFATTPSAIQTTLKSVQDAFVTKLNSAGSGLLYSTYLGGNSDDEGDAIVVDASGNAFVTGFTASTDFPLLNPFQATHGGGRDDVFVTKLNPLGSALVYSTYLGGSGFDDGFGIAIDAAGNAYVTGQTSSGNFPTVNPIQSTQGGTSGTTDAFVTKLNPSGSGLVYSTYLGGAGDDAGFGIGLDGLPNPNAYIAGQTSSANFPTTSGAFQTTYGGNTDAFVAKLADVVIPPGPSTGKVTGGGTIDVTGGIGSFGFIVRAQSPTGPINGDLQYQNHFTGATIHSQTFTTFVVSGTTATFGGTCTMDGVPCTFSVTVQDNGEPGQDDKFTISIDLGSPEGGTLRSGNIQIHQCPC